MNDTIAELTALEAKATPEPWEEQDDDEVGAEGKHVATFYCFNSRFDAWRVTKEEQKANAALTVAMRNALPEVLREIKLAWEQKAIYELAGKSLAANMGDELRALRARAEKAEAALSRAEAALVKLAIKVEEMGGGNGEYLMRVAIEDAAQEAAKRKISCNDEGKCSICKWIETENCYDCFFNDHWEAAKRGEETPSCATCAHNPSDSPDACDKCIYAPDADGNDASLSNYWEAAQEAAKRGEEA